MPDFISIKNWLEDTFMSTACLKSLVPNITTQIATGPSKAW